MKNIDKFTNRINYLDKMIQKLIVDEDKKEKIQRLISDFSNVMYVTPGAMNSKSVYCVQGGWIQYVCDVISLSFEMTELLKNNKYSLDFTTEQLFTSALLFNIGNLGTSHEPLILKQQSTYKINNGYLYRYNPDIPYMKTYDRTLFILNNYNIKLTENQYLSIRLFSGLFEPNDTMYYNMFKIQLSDQRILPYIIQNAVILTNLKKVKK